MQTIAKADAAEHIRPHLATEKTRKRTPTILRASVGGSAERGPSAYGIMPRPLAFARRPVHVLLLLAGAAGKVVDDLVDQMTLTEKISLLHGTGATQPFVGNVPGIPRLGIPALALNDGPQGFRADAYPGTSTQWPSALTVAASWDRALMGRWATAMGREFLNKGANVFLGPGLNVARVDRNGRNFEYLSGEDPYFGAQMVVPFVRNMQAEGVVAVAKHFALNNFETQRTTISVEVDERTWHEMYLPPFEAAVRSGGVGSFMCSYNRVGSVWACENKDLLRTTLRAELGFQGWVMSDWGATHSASIAQGLDMEMPGGKFMNERKLAGADLGLVNASVRSILGALDQVGALNAPPPPPDAVASNVTSDKHRALARELAIESCVLLKNDGVLPIDPSRRSSVLVLGSPAWQPVTGGGGSGAVVPASVKAPYDAIRERLPSSTIVYSSSDVWGVDGLFDYVILFVACSSSEAADRPSLDLGGGQGTLANFVSRLFGHRLIVVVTSPGAVLTKPWADRAGAVLATFMPGEQFADAIAAVLVGDEPGGRLPVTFPNAEGELGWTREQYPGKHGTVTYSERALFGYRWYDHHARAPAFSFGHGLSYGGPYRYTRVCVKGRLVSLHVKNEGERPGAEVAQLYVRLPATASAPYKQLRGWQKLRLKPGESKKVEFALTDRDLSYWDTSMRTWVLATGEAAVEVGSSSTDVRLKAVVLVERLAPAAAKHGHAA